MILRYALGYRATEVAKILGIPPDPAARSAIRKLGGCVDQELRSMDAPGG